MLTTITACVKAFHNGEYALLPVCEKQSILFLFSPYAPFFYHENAATVDAYYVKSHICHANAKALVDDLNSAGVGAEFYQKNDVKVLARKCGGAFGKNNLLFLEGVGSRFFITAILLDGIFSKSVKTVEMPCEGCGKCVAACPSNALENGFCRERCLRNWHSEPAQMPEELRHLNGKRLLGCDVCQTVCPMNAQKTEPAPTELANLLCLGTLQERCGQKDYLTELGQFIGSNYARKNRISGMAAIIAENMACIQKTES